MMFDFLVTSHVYFNGELLFYILGITWDNYNYLQLVAKGC